MREDDPYASWPSLECEDGNHEACQWMMETVDGPRACPCKHHRVIEREITVGGETKTFVMSLDYAPPGITILNPEDMFSHIMEQLIRDEQEKRRIAQN